MASGRGDYRSIHTVLVDSPEFLCLSPAAQLVFFHLKLRLGPTGIDVFPAAEAVLAATTNLDVESVRTAFAELQGSHTQCHPDGMGHPIPMGRNAVSEGWLVREGNILWLRNALRYEPSRSLANDNHRKGIERHLASLPKFKIVNDFAAYYELGKPFPDLCHPDPIPNAIPMPSRSHTQSRKTETEDGERKTEDGERKRKTETEDGERKIPPLSRSARKGRAEPRPSGPDPPGGAVVKLPDRQAQPPPAKRKPRETAVLVRRVFATWQTVLKHPRARLDDKRRRVIRRALKLGYTAEDLEEAIRGCAVTPHNMGFNDRGTKYDDLGLILRDADHIDRFIRNARHPPRPVTKEDVRQAVNRANSRKAIQMLRKRDARHPQREETT